MPHLLRKIYSDRRPELASDMLIRIFVSCDGEQATQFLVTQLPKEFATYVTSEGVSLYAVDLCILSVGGMSQHFAFRNKIFCYYVVLARHSIAVGFAYCCVCMGVTTHVRPLKVGVSA